MAAQPTHFFLGSGDQLDFSLAELEEFFPSSSFTQQGAVFTGALDSSDEQYVSRLAYVPKAYRFIFQCEEKQLVATIKAMDFTPHITGTYKIRVAGKQNMERKLGDVVWFPVQDPKVSMKSPDTVIDFVYHKGQVYCGILLCENSKNFDARRNKYRPRPHPTGLHPKFARFLINLSGIREGILYDPFCGIGGILLEGALLGYTLLGADLSADMLMRCDENMKFYGVQKYHLMNANSEEIKHASDVMVTDVPYGKNSRIEKEIEETYKEFLSSARGKTKRIVVVFPSFSDFRSCLGEWKIRRELTRYVHKSLTRHILVLE